MDIERSLVTKVVASGQLEAAIAFGVRPEHFADEQCQEMYLHLLEHARKFGSPPSMQMLKAQIKANKRLRDFEWHHTEDALEAISEEFISVVKRRFANDTVVELAKLCDDPDQSRDIDLHFFEASRQLAMLVPSTQVDRFSNMPERIAEYEKRVAEGDKFGILTGFEDLDKWTGGIQPHEFCVVAGFSGLGKSTLLMQMAFNAYMAGHTPLYISLEMESKAILRKFDAMAASLTYQNLKHLELPESEIKDWKTKAKEIQAAAAKHDIPVIDSIRGCNPDHVFGETIRHKPDIVFIDYLGLMRSARPHNRGSSLWQSITEITQDLKQNARTLGIPIVAAAQTNRAGAKEGADLDNIGGSISVTQDADIMIGLFADDEMKEQKLMELRLNKNRDGRLGKLTAIWDHEKLDFRQQGTADKFTKKKKEAEGGEAPKLDPAKNPFAKKVA
jgi:replicative DNA helicase